MKGQFSRQRRQTDLLIRTEPDAIGTTGHKVWEAEDKKERWWRRRPWGKMFRWLRPIALLGPVCLLFGTIYIETPRYRAEATLLIDTRSEPSLGGYEPVGRSVSDLKKDNDRTYYELLRNRNLASLVIREQGLNGRAWRDDAQVPEQVPPVPKHQLGDVSVVSIQKIEAYLSDLEIVPVQETRLVKVAFSASDPHLAARIANAHAKAFIRQTQEHEFDSQLRAFSITLVDKAIPASQPNRSQTTKSLFFGIVLWTLGSGAGLYWFSHRNRKVQTPADVASLLDLATLGMIPDFSMKDIRAEGALPLPPQMAALPGVFSKDLLLAYHPLSLVPESYRNLRAELLLSCPSGPPRFLLMTSGMSGEGKTLTVLNTAISLAQMGARVLIVDADLRHPHCHTVLRMPKGLGLTEFLTGQRELAEVIQTTRVERLFFLSGGVVPPNPAELLGSKRMRAALSFLGHMYDYIVIDSPPLGLVRDASLLSPLVDGVVLVVNSQKTQLKTVQEAHQHLVHVHAKILGVVLNKMDTQSRDYVDYCRRYRAYYRQTGGANDEVYSAVPSRGNVSTSRRTEPVKKIRKSTQKGDKQADVQLLSVGSSLTEAKEKSLPQTPVPEVENQVSETTALIDETKRPGAVEPPQLSSLSEEPTSIIDQVGGWEDIEATRIVDESSNDGEPNLSQDTLEEKKDDILVIADAQAEPRIEISCVTDLWAPGADAVQPS